MSSATTNCNHTARHRDPCGEMGSPDAVPTVQDFLLKEFGAAVAQAMLDAGVLTYADVLVLAEDEDLTKEVFTAAGAASSKLSQRKLRTPAFQARVKKMEEDADRWAARLTELASRVHAIHAAEVVLERFLRMRDSGKLTAVEYAMARRAELRKIGVEAVDDGAAWTREPREERPIGEKKGLSVHPATADQFVQLVDMTTGDLVGAPVPSNAAPVTFDGVPPGKYHVVFYVPQTMPCQRGEPPAAVDAPGSCVISKCAIELHEDGATTPAFFDTGATEAIVRSLRADAPITDQPSTFVGDGVNATRYPDANGAANATLPPGTFTATTPTGTETIAVVDRPRVDKAPPAGSGHGQQPVIVSVGGSTFAAGVSTTASHIAVLGDVSGSMSSGNLMTILRKSFADIAAKYPVETHTVCFGAWNTNVVFAPEDRSKLAGWINGLSAGGGNNMRHAIEQALVRFPQVQEVFVMCDGDINPFAVGSDSASWNTFANEHSEVRFHFIALGEGADGERMKLMAAAGRGSFMRHT